MEERELVQAQLTRAVEMGDADRIISREAPRARARAR